LFGVLLKCRVSRHSTGVGGSWEW